LTAITNSSNRFNVTFSRIFSPLAITNTSSKQLCNLRLPAWWHSTPQSATHCVILRYVTLWAFTQSGCWSVGSTSLTGLCTETVICFWNA